MGDWIANRTMAGDRDPGSVAVARNNVRIDTMEHPKRILRFRIAKKIDTVDKMGVDIPLDKALEVSDLMR